MIISLLNGDMKISNPATSLLIILPLLTLVIFLVTITLSMAIVLGQEEQNWLTYNSSEFGYSIQYPSDWDDYGGEGIYENTSTLLFGFPEKDGNIGLYLEPVEKYLDTDTLTLKTKTLHNYTIERIAWINSQPDLEFVKNISTTIGQNHYPASQIHYWRNLKEEYNIDTLIVNDRYSYFFNFDTHPLNVPELSPTIEKVLA